MVFCRTCVTHVAGNGWLGLEDLSEDSLLELGVAEQLTALSAPPSVPPAVPTLVRVDAGPAPIRRMSTSDITTHYWCDRAAEGAHAHRSHLMHIFLAEGLMWCGGWRG